MRVEARMASIATMRLTPAVMLPGWSVLFMVLQQLPGDAGRMVLTIPAFSLQPFLLSEDSWGAAMGSVRSSPVWP